MICKFKGCDVRDEKKLQLHHIVPRSLFPPSFEKNKEYDTVIIDGEETPNRVFLCEKHHQIIQGMSLKYVFNLLDEKMKDEIRHKLFWVTMRSWVQVDKQ